MEDIKCIGFIMDGNRRWAKELGKPSLEGHRAGYKKFKDVIEWCSEKKIENVIFYAFSTENWNRSEEEVSYLMDLMAKAFKEMEVVHKHKFRVRVLGQVDRLSKKLQESVRKMEEDTKDYTNGTVGIALSYGGRADIVQATNKLLARGVKEVTEEDFSQELWTSEMHDPDIIVRLGEVMRLSNFLTWDSAYSELYFTSTLWPDFDKEEFTYILESFDVTKRNIGK